LRGRVHLDTREYDRAIEDIDQSIKLDPSCPIGFNARGVAYELKGQGDRAAADYDRAIELDPSPGNASIFLRRAQAYQGKRDYDHAIEDFGQALKLEPRNARVLNGRCFARAIAGDFDSALARDANILDSRAFTYLKKGVLDQALADYDAVLRIDARMAISLYGRAVVKRRNGDIAGSEADIAAAKAIRPNVADVMARYGIE
jgi:Tfp pilus assembly protein PilF